MAAIIKSNYGCHTQIRFWRSLAVSGKSVESVPVLLFRSLPLDALLILRMLLRPKAAPKIRAGFPANRIMRNEVAQKTIHVYRSDGVWTVKKAGTSARTFPTQRAAIAAAKETARKQSAAQVVVHGKNGEILDYGAYRTVKIQDPPKKSRIAGRIGRIVGKVALERVRSDDRGPS